MSTGAPSQNPAGPSGGIGPPGPPGPTADIATYNVQDYGAIPDGVTDCITAIEAAMAAMGPANAGLPSVDFRALYGAILLFPPGNLDSSINGGRLPYYCSRELQITRNMIVRGANGASAFGSSVLLFPEGSNGIVVMNDAGGSGKSAPAAIIQNLVIKGPTIRPASPIPGAVSFWRHWLPSTAYTLNQTIVPDWTMMNITGRTLKCTTAGTSGTTTPNFDDLGSTTFNDGSVVWTVVDAHGVYMHATAKLENVGIVGFSGNGININSDGGGNNDLWQVTGQSVSLYCGGNGIYVQGNDANAGCCQGLNASDCNGWGFVDKSFLGNTWVSTHSSGCGRGSYYFDTGFSYAAYAEIGAGGVFISNKASMHNPVVPDGLSGDYFPPRTNGHVYAAGDKVRPNTPNGMVYQALSNFTAGVVEPTWKIGRLWETVQGVEHWQGYSYESPIIPTAGGSFTLISSSTPIQITSRGVVNSVQVSVGPTINPGQMLGIKYSADSDGFNYLVDGIGAGWHSWGYALDLAPTGNTRQAYAVSTDRAVSGGTARTVGQLMIPNTHYIGTHLSGNQVEVGCGAAPPAAGTWKKGTLWWNTNTVSGQPNYWRCTATGTPGTWVGFDIVP